MKMKWLTTIGLTVSIALFGTGCSEANTSTSSSTQPKQTTTNLHKNIKDSSQSKEVSTQTQSTQTSSSSTPTVEGKLKVYFFDVGQGDSFLVQTPKNENILIDGGNNDKGDDVVRYLKQLHVSQLDDMIATHPDADHIGGLDTVLNNVKVKNVYTPRVTHNTKTYEDFLLAVKNAGLKIKQAKAGVNLGLKGATMKLVAPVKDYEAEMNDWSAVAKLSFGKNGTFLFTGDAPFLSEDDMMATHQDISAQVLKVGHHGSKYSTSQAFLEVVKPKFAVISVGKGNRYGHPNDVVMNRLKANHIQIFRTDEMKTILATTDGNIINFQSVPSLTPNGSSGGTTNISPAPIKPSVPHKVVAPPKKTAPKQTQPSNGTLKATLDNTTPQDYHEIHLLVTGMTGATYTATFHYKSKDTVYEGTVGTPLPVRISRATSGYEVVIDIEVTANGKTYSTQTSFVPQ